MGFHSDHGELILQDLAVKSLTDLQGLLPSAEAVEQAEDRLRPGFFFKFVQWRQHGRMSKQS